MLPDSLSIQMKLLSIALLLTALLPGQAPEPIKVTPGTPSVKAPAEPGQAVPVTPPPPVSPDTVVAEVDGKKITAAEMDKILNGLAAADQQTVRARPQLLTNVFLMRRLAEDAEKAGIDKQSPYKEQLDAYRMRLLSNAEANTVNNTTPVSEEEERKYYQGNPGKFEEIKVRVIYIAYNPMPGKTAPDAKKLPTEAEALAKIQDLAKQIQGGADFGKLARENSDDQTSAGKDGDFGVIKQDSTLPKEVKDAVFALKQGEISAPVKQPNGFYLLRADEINQQSFAEATFRIIPAVRQEKFDAWMKVLQTQYSVKIESPAYFAPRVPAQLQQVH
jgi:peptidyl-prolyl cis-trans isomerase C